MGSDDYESAPGWLAHPRATAAAINPLEDFSLHEAECATKFSVWNTIGGGQGVDVAGFDLQKRTDLE
jgi:hypothetical protein